MSTMLSLDERISGVFADGVRSDSVSDLIKEVQIAAANSGTAADQARARALDPALSARDVADARREMEDAAFRRERLQTAVIRLQERLDELRASEKDQRLRVIYEQVEAERDRVAADLASIYPDIAERLSELMAHIAANDQHVESVNRALPHGKERLLVAELVARGLGGFVRNGLSIPSITQQLRLPSFGSNVHEAYVWPRTRQIASQSTLSTEELTSLFGWTV